jgi:hypothetical protein
MHPIQDLFLEGFSYVLQIDMHFICTPMWTKFYSCKKWVLHQVHIDWGALGGSTPSFRMNEEVRTQDEPEELRIWCIGRSIPRFLGS